MRLVVLGMGVCARDPKLEYFPFYIILSYWGHIQDHMSPVRDKNQITEYTIVVFKRKCRICVVASLQ